MDAIAKLQQVLHKYAQNGMGTMSIGPDPSIIMGGKPTPPPDVTSSESPKLSDEDIRKIIDGVAKTLSENRASKPPRGDDKSRDMDDIAAIRSDISELKDQMAQLMGILEPLLTALSGGMGAGPMPPPETMGGAGSMPPGQPMSPDMAAMAGGRGMPSPDMMGPGMPPSGGGMIPNTGEAGIPVNA